jgi:hypothetical protein
MLGPYCTREELVHMEDSLAVLTYARKHSTKIGKKYVKIIFEKELFC